MKSHVEGVRGFSAPFSEVCPRALNGGNVGEVAPPVTPVENGTVFSPRNGSFSGTKLRRKLQSHALKMRPVTFFQVFPVAFQSQPQSAEQSQSRIWAPDHVP